MTGSAANPPSLSAHTQLGQSDYEVVRCLGVGGMSEVYEVRHRVLRRAAAAKVLHPELVRRWDLARGLEDEARISAALSHPRFVQAYDLGRLDDGRPYYIMAKIEGNTLSQEIARFAPLSEATASRIAVQILEGLAALHGRGYVHCDIKPCNVLVDPQGAIRIIDLGLCCARGERFRWPGGGTPPWMAPEQAASGIVDAGTDLYAVGLMLEAMLFGERRDFELTPGERSVCPGLEQAILRAVHPEPSCRFGSAREMRAAILRRGSSRSARPDPATSPDGQSPRQTRRGLFHIAEEWTTGAAA